MPCTTHKYRAGHYLGQFQAALGRGDQLHADHLLIYGGDGGSRPVAAHLGEPPHGLLPDAGKVLQSHTMWPQCLHHLQKQDDSQRQDSDHAHLHDRMQGQVTKSLLQYGM